MFPQTEFFLMFTFTYVLYKVINSCYTTTSNIVLNHSTDLFKTFDLFSKVTSKVSLTSKYPVSDWRYGAV